jgi:DHA2 family multidrug resistance protein-like MFS transporter
LLLAIGPLLLPEFRDPAAGRIDPISAAMSIAAVLLIIFGIKRFAETGAFAVPAAFISIGMAVGWVFLRRQLHLSHPLVELSLFRSFAFSAALLLGVIAFFVNFGTFFLLAQYLQLALGLDPLQAGLWTMPAALGFVAGALVSPRVAARVRPGIVMAGGFALAALGLGILTQAGLNGLAIVVAGSVVLSVGLAPVIILSTDLIVGAAPPERAGSASAMSETSAELGGALGIAILGSVVTAIYRGRTSGLALDGIPSEAVAAARDTLGGAAAVARELPANQGVAFFEIAREAFTAGVQASAAVSACLAVIAALLALGALRASRPNAT